MKMCFLACVPFLSTLYEIRCLPALAPMLCRQSLSQGLRVRSTLSSLFPRKEAQNTSDFADELLEGRLQQRIPLPR